MLKTIALLAAIALLGLLAFAASRPDVFHVQRSIRIHAGTDKIQPLIQNLHRFNTWNHFNKKDPNLEGHYQGPDSGPGASFSFKGNKDVGSGSLTVTQVAPDRVGMRLDMLAPFEAHNEVEFVLRPDGDSTEVSWAMQCPSPFIAKLMGLFFDMDKMIGQDFENGLQGLKTLAEQA